MKAYTLGFIFNRDLSKVLLVHKLTPSWQHGRINGVGGKVESGETVIACMIREVEEETALVTHGEQWHDVGILSGPGWTMSVYTMVYQGDEKDALQNGKEIVEWFDRFKIPEAALSNLHWLIPLSIDVIENHYFAPISVTYHT